MAAQQSSERPHRHPLQPPDQLEASLFNTETMPAPRPSYFNKALMQMKGPCVRPPFMASRALCDSHLFPRAVHTSGRGCVGGCIRPIVSVGVEAMQAMGHVMAEVDARQWTLGKVLRIHDLHSY